MEDVETNDFLYQMLLSLRMQHFKNIMMCIFTKILNLHTSKKGSICITKKYNIIKGKDNPWF